MNALQSEWAKLDGRVEVLANACHGLDLSRKETRGFLPSHAGVLGALHQNLQRTMIWVSTIQKSIIPDRAELHLTNDANPTSSGLPSIDPNELGNDPHKGMTTPDQVDDADLNEPGVDPQKGTTTPNSADNAVPKLSTNTENGGTLEEVKNIDPPVPSEEASPPDPKTTISADDKPDPQGTPNKDVLKDEPLGRDTKAIDEDNNTPIPAEPESSSENPYIQDTTPLQETVEMEKNNVEDMDTGKAPPEDNPAPGDPPRRSRREGKVPLEMKKAQEKRGLSPDASVYMSSENETPLDKISIRSQRPNGSKPRGKLKKLRHGKNSTHNTQRQDAKANTSNKRSPTPPVDPKRDQPDPKRQPTKPTEATPNLIPSTTKQSTILPDVSTKKCTATTPRRSEDTPAESGISSLDMDTPTAGKLKTPDSIESPTVPDSPQHSSDPRTGKKGDRLRPPLIPRVPKRVQNITTPARVPRREPLVSPNGPLDPGHGLIKGGLELVDTPRLKRRESEGESVGETDATKAKITATLSKDGPHDPPIIALCDWLKETIEKLEKDKPQPGGLEPITNSRLKVVLETSICAFGRKPTNHLALISDITCFTAKGGLGADQIKEFGLMQVETKKGKSLDPPATLLLAVHWAATSTPPTTRLPAARKLTRVEPKVVLVLAALIWLRRRGGSPVVALGTVAQKSGPPSTTTPNMGGKSNDTTPPMRQPLDLKSTLDAQPGWANPFDSE